MIANLSTLGAASRFLLENKQKLMTAHQLFFDSPYPQEHDDLLNYQLQAARRDSAARRRSACARAATASPAPNGA